MEPHPKHGDDQSVDLRANEPAADRVLDEADVRAVLESAADVIFSDGVSPEFLDQWTFETMQLLEARTARDQVSARAKPVSAGRR